MVTMKMAHIVLNPSMAGTLRPRKHSNSELSLKMQQSNLGISARAVHKHGEGNIVHNQGMGALAKIAFSRLEI
jgi:hypothetical protein